jgi:hypothetical protein
VALNPVASRLAKKSCPTYALVAESPQSTLSFGADSTDKKYYSRGYSAGVIERKENAEISTGHGQKTVIASFAPD